jgi:hypothetical protein
MDCHCQDFTLDGTLSQYYKIYILQLHFVFFYEVYEGGFICVLCSAITYCQVVMSQHQVNTGHQ